MWIQTNCIWAGCGICDSANASPSLVHWENRTGFLCRAANHPISCPFAVGHQLPCAGSSHLPPIIAAFGPQTCMWIRWSLLQECGRCTVYQPQLSPFLSTHPPSRLPLPGTLPWSCLLPRLNHPGLKSFYHPVWAACIVSVCQGFGVKKTYLEDMTS